MIFPSNGSGAISVTELTFITYSSVFCACARVWYLLYVRLFLCMFLCVCVVYNKLSDGSIHIFVIDIQMAHQFLMLQSMLPV